MKAIVVLIHLVCHVVGQLSTGDPPCSGCPDVGEGVWPPSGFVLDEAALRCSFRCGAETTTPDQVMYIAKLYIAT